MCWENECMCWTVFTCFYEEEITDQQKGSMNTDFPMGALCSFCSLKVTLVLSMHQLFRPFITIFTVAGWISPWCIAVSALILLSQCQSFLSLWPESSLNPPLYNWLFLFLVGQIIVVVQVPGSLSLLSVAVSHNKLKNMVSVLLPPRKRSRGLHLLLLAFKVYIKVSSLAMSMKTDSWWLLPAAHLPWLLLFCCYITPCLCWHGACSAPEVLYQACALHCTNAQLPSPIFPATPSFLSPCHTHPITPHKGYVTAIS